MIISSDKIWPRDEDGLVNITIGFYNPSGRYRGDISAVKKIAKEWEEAVPNLRFRWCYYHNIRSCQVRIMFNPDTSRSAWSKVGTEALREDSSKPTMQLESTYNIDKDEWERIVRHEFGHMLGADHEHQSPEFPWDFNHQMIVNDKRPLEFAQINILFRYRPSDRVIYSRFDEKSIMLYPFTEAELTQRDAGFPRREISGNFTLSEIDKGYMRNIYGSSEYQANPNSPSRGSLATRSSPENLFSPANNICGDAHCGINRPFCCVADYKISFFQSPI